MNFPAVEIASRMDGWGWLVALIAYIVHSAALSSLAERAGVSPRWLAWIPLLNLVTASKVARVPSILLLPVILISCGLPYLFPLYVAFLWCMIAKRTDKPWWVGVGVLIPLVQIIVWLILGGSDIKES